jgi:hypothetical protein
MHSRLSIFKDAYKQIIKALLVTIADAMKTSEQVINWFCKGLQKQTTG